MFVQIIYLRTNVHHLRTFVFIGTQENTLCLLGRRAVEGRMVVKYNLCSNRFSVPTIFTLHSANYGSYFSFVCFLLLFQEMVNTLYYTVVCCCFCFFLKKVTYTFHFKCGFFNENIVMSVHAKQVHINMRLHLSHINIHA